MTAAETLAAELVQLVRSLRELGAALPATGGRRLDLPAAAVLGHVGDAGPLRLSDLADRLCLDVSTVSRQVAALERAGWLDRAADPGDRRASLLALTDEGRAVLAERRRAAAALLREALPAWTEEELSDLAAGLSRLTTDLTAHRQASPTLAPAAPVTQEAS